MLSEEVLIPLIVNELANGRRTLVGEMKDKMKICNAKVSCRGGYHLEMGI